MSTYKVALFALVICFITLTNAFYIDPKDINPQTYCGISPYPQAIAPLPQLNAKSRAMGLKQLDQHIFFRHGDRSTIADKCFQGIAGFENKVWVECPNPIYNFHMGLKNRQSVDKSYFNDYRINVQPLEHKNVLDGNCHFGQLTQKGLMMSFNNGLRYAKYLNMTQSTPLTLQQFKARSTDVHRTRETGTSFLTGLLDNLVNSYTLPANFTQTTNIPTFTFVDPKVDGLAMNDNVCPTGKYLKEAYADPKWVDYTEKVYNPLQTAVQTLLNNQHELYDIFDCAKTLYCHNNPIPAGLEQYHTQMEAALLNYYHQAYQYNHTLANILFTGAHATEMLPHFLNLNNADNQGTDRNYYLYSGHDSNVQSMLSLLAFGNFQWPPYSALLQLEFYKSKDNKSTYVRFIYDNQIVIPAYCSAKTVINDELCPIEGLIELYTKALPKHGECPGIPRQQVTALRVSFDQNEAFISSTTTSDNIKGFLQHMSDLYEQQDQSQLLQEVQEMTDVERWAKFAGQ